MPSCSRLVYFARSFIMVTSMPSTASAGLIPLLRIFRMVSLGSVIAAALLPVFTYIFRAFVEHQTSGVVWFCTAMAILIAAILIIKHIPNIKRIAAGTESKLSFGGKK